MAALYGSVSSGLGVFVGLAASLAINRPCSAGWIQSMLLLIALSVMQGDCGWKHSGVDL